MVLWPRRDGNRRSGTGSSSRSTVSWAPRPPCALAAQAADLEHIDVVDRPVRTGVTDPRDIVRYRLSQPQRALFLAELSEAARRRVVDECVAAVAELGEAFDPGVVLLAARA